MPRLSIDEWAEARAYYEIGNSISAASRKFNISRAAISKRIKKEKWQQSLEPQIRRATEAMVAGTDASHDPIKRKDAIDEEAGKRAAVIHRHRQEWLTVANLRQEALDSRPDQKKPENGQPIECGTHKDAFDKAKLAKITAEMTAIQQAGERKAWGLDQKDEEETPAKVKVEIVREAEEDQWQH